MAAIVDGPASPHFRPLEWRGNAEAGAAPRGMSGEMASALGDAPRGACVCWGIPFEIGEVVFLSDQAVAFEVGPTRARWLVFLHTSDVRPAAAGPGGILSPMRGSGRLAEHAAAYVILYADGSEERAAIRRRHQLGDFRRHWGENCFQAVAQHKPCPRRAAHEQLGPDWGETQTRVAVSDDGPWVNWLWAWENPRPDREIVGLRFEPASGLVVVSAVSAGDVASLPLRWQRRRKARLLLPAAGGEREAFRPELDGNGLLGQIQLDLGQVISARPRPLYPADGWAESYAHQVPEPAAGEILVEYTAHPDACFHLLGPAGRRTVPVVEVEMGGAEGGEPVLQAVAPAERMVTLRVIECGSRRPVACKLHLHGEAGEYLAPVDRHRILNPAWFEDYSAEWLHVAGWADLARSHACTYIDGETRIKLPQGKVYVEVSKGFEIRPVRQVVEVTSDTEEIEVEIERVLPWREKGWVTADTHVHFLSPATALLEGAAEGVNVVNLLASQWGELMTNVGDFDGRTTWGSREAGGDGEYLVRVGTENRQHVLGHISLLGYRGPIIAPMTCGGPDESALGDAVEVLLVEWARQCRSQGGLVVLPHFPNPRAEHAAAVVCGDVDAVEMTSWENLYSGIDPYSLSDWYRYLNCGYPVPAVGGTDKMTAATAVGTVRTYARVPPDVAFDYEAWKAAVRGGETFVTYGPLLEFAVEGRSMGRRIALGRGGGRLDVAWQVASCTVPMSRVELVVNGEIRESVAIPPGEASGRWSVRVERSSWLALLVRGHYPDKPEIIAAHSSPVMAEVEGSPLLAAADGVTILDQIEGALAYLDTVGTRAEDRAYKRMRLVLESAQRSLHHRLHREGYYHDHAPGGRG